MKPILAALILILLTIPAFSQSESALDTAITDYLAELEVADLTEANAAAVVRLCDNQPPKACLISQAAELIDQMQGSPSEAGALRDFAIELAKGGSTFEALRAVAQFETSASKFALIAHITVLIHTGRFSEARGMTDQIENALEKVQILTKLAIALIEAGELSNALTFVGQSDQIQADSLALMLIANALAKNGEIDAARQMLNTAYQVASQLYDPFDRARNLRYIAIALTEAGELETALEVSERIFDVSHKFRAQNEMVMILAQEGRLEDARHVADQIEHMPTKVTALTYIILGLYEAGQEMEARSMIGQAQGMTSQIEQLDARAGALQDIAIALAKTGAIKEARLVFEDALAVAMQIEDGRDQRSTLTSHAVALSNISELDTALEMANALPALKLQEVAYQSIAVRLARENAALEARNVVALITDDTQNSRTISFIANLFASTGNLVEAYSWSQEILNPRKRVVILTRIAAQL